MITKAIVEEVISPYQVKVRIPIFDRAPFDALSTNSDNLHKATICTLPNCYVNLQVGDVVFVGFEDNTTYKVVVLGHLCKEAVSSTYPEGTFKSLTINDVATLPKETQIGSVTAQDLSCLSGIKDNVQKQLDAIVQMQELLYKTLFPEEESNS